MKGLFEGIRISTTAGHASANLIGIAFSYPQCQAFIPFKMTMFKIYLTRLEEGIELLCSTGRYPEAAFMARTYLPSHVSK